MDKFYKHFSCENECSICLEQLNDEVCVLKCKHEFHYDCLTMWVLTCKKKKNKILCPLCKQNFEICTVINKVNDNKFKTTTIKKNKMKLSKNSSYNQNYKINNNSKKMCIVM